MHFSRVFLLAVAASALPTDSTSKGTSLRLREEEEENKVKSQGQFDTDTAVKGGDLFQAVAMPPTTVGSIEVEYQNKVANSFTVTENKAPASPPVGFKAVDPSSFKVQFTGDVSALTRGQIDYIGTDAATVDISQAQIGRLCTETNSFLIMDSTVAEREFEADENELAFTLRNTALMNGEFGVFVADPAASSNTGAATGGTTAGGTTTTGSIVDTLLSLLGGGNAAA
ncbi:hypothetical protein F4780DRAFT_793705 [Xylariomycetidae sp. FL0641]|nr:hypothetical protein F4780DRAFT_793705 [Xylariomycetidae sp. FL0641]